MEGGNRRPRGAHRPRSRGGVRLSPWGGDERARPRRGEGCRRIPHPRELPRNLRERERCRTRRQRGRPPRERDPRQNRGEPVPPHATSGGPDCGRPPEGGSEGGARTPPRRADPRTRLETRHGPAGRNLRGRRGPRASGGRRPDGGPREDEENRDQRGPEPALADIADGDGPDRGRTHPRDPERDEVREGTRGGSEGGRTNRPDVRSCGEPARFVLVPELAAADPRPRVEGKEAVTRLI